MFAVQGLFPKRHPVRGDRGWETRVQITYPPISLCHCGKLPKSRLHRQVARTTSSVSALAVNSDGSDRLPF
jgi:hypothetical protein